MGSERKILVSLTSLAAISEFDLSGWRPKIQEIKKFGLTEIALFLTGLQKEERKELYEALENTSIKIIPHVHLKTDMSLEELDYLSERYKVEVFNLHSTAEWPLMYDYGKYFEKIFIENCWNVPKEEEIKKFGGLCVDFAHWEGKRLENDLNYDKNMTYAVENYRIGCAHVSVIKDKPTPVVINKNLLMYDSHEMESLRELDYIKRYKKYLPNIISIELENSIKEQIEAKKYLEKILNL